MKPASDNQYHIDMHEGQVGRYVLLPGDPGRAEAIAARFDRAWKVAHNREYVTYTGYAGDTLISVCSTGIGAPSTAIAVEELARIGADTFIRVGTAGVMQPQVKAGDVVIGSAAIRDEGTSLHYMPVEFPAVADFEVTRALQEAAAASGKKAHVGVIHSKDSFYGQHEPDSMPTARHLKERWQGWVQGGALASEMEAAALYVIASIRRLRAGCILNVLDYGNMTATIDVAVEAVRLLAQRDGTGGLRGGADGR